MTFGADKDMAQNPTSENLNYKGENLASWGFISKNVSDHSRIPYFSRIYSKKGNFDEQMRLF